VATALATICESDFNGDINVGTGEGISVERLARMLASRLGCDALVQVPEQPGNDPYGYVVACAGRLKALGWRPVIKLEDGIDRVIRSVRAEVP
jgi:nucleoside-diphosphate-sugar epimerase